MDLDSIWMLFICGVYVRECSYEGLALETSRLARNQWCLANAIMDSNRDWFTPQGDAKHSITAHRLSYTTDTEMPSKEHGIQDFGVWTGKKSVICERVEWH